MGLGLGHRGSGFRGWGLGVSGFRVLDKQLRIVRVRRGWEVGKTTIEHGRFEVIHAQLPLMVVLRAFRGFGYPYPYPKTLKPKPETLNPELALNPKP